MSGKHCGCTTATCGCCEGIATATPVDIENRPGLSQVAYRVGTHGEFFATMKARLSTMTVDAPGADGQTIETFRPLDGLTTRASDDPSIALLDGLATVADVLTFYQERIANEGYLRTATERRSVLELARLVGYSLRPGVASSVYLTYTLEDSQAEPVEIEVGRRSQSIPGPGEFPQFFETADTITARREWNNLLARTRRPQALDVHNLSTGVLVAETVWVAGTNTNLKQGDQLLFELRGGKAFVVRIVEKVEADFEAKRTAIHLFSYPGTGAAVALLSQFIQDALKVIGSSTGPGITLVLEATEIIQDLMAGLPSDPLTWVPRMIQRNDNDPPDSLKPLVDKLTTDIEAAVAAPTATAVATDVGVIESLLLPVNEQKRSSQALGRSLQASFALGSDASAQMLVGFAPALRRTYYQAWANATASATVGEVTGVFAVRAAAQLFGATVSKIPKFSNNTLQPPPTWDEWDLDSTESPTVAHLDQGYEAILAGSYVIIESGQFERKRSILKVQQASTAPRTAYGFSGKSTRLTLSDEWWKANTQTDMAVLRSTQIFGQPERLELIEEPITQDVEGQEIELQLLYDGLTSGRWVILSGDRTDIEGTKGVRASELHMISAARTGLDPARAGDRLHTTLILATPTAYRYKRDTLKIYANVVRATHGETRQETLGSGDGAQSLQSFSLRQPPLTFVPAPTISGVESTLQVFVNDVQWHEKTTLSGAKATDRIFVTQTNDAGATWLIFGNGHDGARLPTGVENVRAVYRNGIGKSGNVPAEQISLVQTAPLGVKSVINPLRASGGANADTREQARENAPLAVMSLDRLVSLQDYEDFTRTFAGIGKARVARLTDGRRELLHLTIAGADDVPIDATSDLYRNLAAALRRFGDPDRPVRLDSRELVELVLSANVRIDDDHVWEVVADEIRRAVLDRFGFAKRALAQPALRSDLIATIQSVRGVVYVDVDTFGGVGEKITVPIAGNNNASVRRLRTPAELSAAIAALLAPSGLGKTKAGLDIGVAADAARVDKTGDVIPAQLAMFSPTVPDTLILNHIT